MLTTDWITLTVTTPPTLALPLGTSPAGEPVSLDLDANPHTLVVGPCGSGKTVLLRHLVAGSSAAGAKTTVIDLIRHGVGFRDLSDIDLVTDETEAIRTLDGVVAEIARRGELLSKHGVSRWQQIPEEVRDAEGVRPIHIFIDEYASIVLEGTLPRGIDQDSDEYREAVERNADMARIKHLIRKIVRESRFLGAHLMIAIQRPDALTVDSEVRENIDNVIMMLRPGHNPSKEFARMAFGADSFEAAAAAIGDTQDSPPGDAVLSSTTGGVQRVNAPYSK